MQTLDSSHIRYDGVSHSSDCLTICQYNTDLNDVLEALLTFVDTCELEIPTCFSLADNKLQTILQGLLDKSCECNVKVSSADNCCGYLADKLISSDGSVSFGYTKTNCQQIDLSVNTGTIDTTIVDTCDFTSVQSTADGATLRTIDISIPILETDGSAFLINTNFRRLDGTYIDSLEPPISLYLNADLISTITLETGVYMAIPYLRINRISDVSVVVTGYIDRYGLFGFFIDRVPIISSTITVTNLDNTTNQFTLKLGTVGAETVVSSYITTDKFRK